MRFDLQLVAWYRAIGDAEWHTGVTHSISTSGAIIEADEPAHASGQVALVIKLPSSTGCLVGRGRVVRDTSADGARHPIFAVAVRRYRIERCRALASA